MKRIYLTIFLVSSAVLMLEISLTRLFSIYLSYHFAFMVISIAMLGIGSAGTALSVYPRVKNISNINVFAMLAGATIILGYIVSNHIPFDPVKLSWDRMQVLYVALYCLVLSIPFFFAGILVATVFSTVSEKSELIYGSDLLGAGIGSMAVLGLLNIKGPEYAVLTASTLCFIASFVAGGRKIRVLVLVFIAVNILLFVSHPDFIKTRLSPYKNLSLFLKYPGAEHLKTYYNSFSRIDTLRSPAVRFAPGLSLTYLEPLPRQVGLSTDGGEMNAVTGSADKEALRFLEFLPSAVAYEIKGKTLISQRDIKDNENYPSPIPLPDASGEGVRGKVLVLEPKGGLHALLAGYYGAKTVHPVRKKAVSEPSHGVQPVRKFQHFSNGVHNIESNPLVLEIIRGDLGEFSGNIFEHNTWSGLGRNRLHASRLTPYASRTYDIIDLPMTGISVSGAFGISEDYRFTVEAFKEYLGALKKNGLMSISLYIIPPPRTELRILGTVITALEQNGIKEASGHIAAIRSWDSITILVKNTPFNKAEIRHIKEFARDKRFDLVHYPGIKQEETNLYVRMPSDKYFKAFKGLLNPESRLSFSSDYLFDIEPVYDENPFFHYYLKLKNIKAIYEVMGQKWQYFIEEGYLLPVVFVIVLILSITMILLPVFFKTQFVPKHRDELFKQSLTLPTLLYFAMLGIGFMFVEVTLIQKSILSLENPAYAVATVLTAILISSGAGSLFGSKFPRIRTQYMLLVLGGLILAYSLILPLLLKFVAPYSLRIKIPMVFASLTPLGFFMGIPFPTGIRLLGQRYKELIPWAWAINGCLSVLAPVLTIMLAMVLGFKTVLWLGASAYLLAFFSLRKLGKD